jgi:hypothetical protein
MHIAWILTACFFAGIVYASFFEWALHRFVMHTNLKFFSYPYRSHAVTHHTVFGSGKDYHIMDEKHRPLVTMAWWNGPVLVVINTPAALLASLIAGTWWAVAPFLGAMTCYYIAYEYFHYCMHVPGPRWFQKTRLFRWVDTHHRLHHLAPNRNLNVVLPLADWTLRTRLKRAPAEEPVSAS